MSAPRPGITRDQRWQRIRAVVNTVPSIDPDDHADGVLAMILSRSREPHPLLDHEQISLADVRRTTPAKPGRTCASCDGMGYQPNNGRCPACAGRGTIPARQRRRVTA